MPHRDRRGASPRAWATMPNPSTFPIENEAKTNHHHCWRPATVTVTCQKLGVTVEREFKITIQVLNSESAVQVTFHWQFKLAEWWPGQLEYSQASARQRSLNARFEVFSGRPGVTVALMVSESALSVVSFSARRELKKGQEGPGARTYGKRERLG